MMVWLFWLSLLLLLGGVLAAVWALASPRGGDARALLAERLARGEISIEEYRERMEALGSFRPRPQPALAIALVVALIGLAGILTVAALGGWRGMGGMMGGMEGMMGNGGMMVRGESGRTGLPPSPGAEELQVTGFEFGFEPSEIRVSSGETVNLVFRNRGMMFHTLTIEELGFDLWADGDESISGALEAGPRGRYEIICAVPGHAEAGMRGTLVIEE